MYSRRNGQVKWFSREKGFGFIIGDDGGEVFAHQTEIQQEGYRFLKRGQRVTFEVQNDDAAGPKAIAIEVVESPVSPAEDSDLDESTDPMRIQPDEAYVHNAILDIEEDREHEFKGMQNAKDPVRTIADYYVEKYVNAFLNTNGGVIHFGIEDDGSVSGIRLDRSQRDLLRTKISKIINKFQPSVEPDLYRLRFAPVLDLEDTYVVELHVCKGSVDLYMTGSQNFYLRRDGSNFMMTFDMLRSRLQSSAVDASRKTVRESAPELLQADSESEDAVKKSGAADLDLGILLAMVFMSWVDESISDREVELLKEKADDEGLEEKEVELLKQALSQPPLLETIASYLPTPESRKAAATVAYLLALKDNHLRIEESEAFDKMCGVLGLSLSEQEEIKALVESRL